MKAAEALNISQESNKIEEAAHKGLYTITIPESDNYELNDEIVLILIEQGYKASTNPMKIRWSTKQ